MIFIRYENWRSYIKQFPVTTLLIIANVAMFIVLVLNGGSQDGMTLLKFGAVWKQEPYASETWRLATAMFLHSGFQHLLFNMFALFVFAPPMERILGSFKYAVLYLLSGLLGNAAALYLSEWGTLAVGASGAIYGVYGAYLFIAIFQRWALDQASRKTIMIILGIGIVQSFVITGISWSAHLGGLAAGFVLYAILQRIRS
ncbi:rhomboid family intramembrane serine protease [Paenibacillus thiaminolyticus]|uniref:Rhomboid family intramembrane serine protease n=1 Tax=Paenibacillus thiaminolyticus TaxID=49283 RepID=A0AAP9DT60_PANTH|nr:rhomboid family intramembrane serine protease [Paenibacillus thiaminolyticus]MCY9533423.1 rhomboid family intramembrane serine protease [Paenibacillus thiaminolyticus]MCY9604088.1 rhomboid family intramembrane serine protease [Paenibacillus thiaminolyticus]MCY9606364.1 rhomboid family intramembrane serine protease [Paenibacillus thiaminolyticus]MCY9612114.1 rhomboid family intramembrane serine protease [Paenibacillus thiaminolyticus]MCY9618135.1 rhomboid family intramembrane serine protease